jgi:flavin prenyltransferase
MKRIVVAITGATGVIYGIRLLEVLKASAIEGHLILSDAAKQNILIETDHTVESVESLAHKVYNVNDLGAALSSGSFHTDGMVIVPCTMKTLSGVAHSYDENLIVRAADVALKERRRLVLVVRETPFHKGHLQLMERVASLGGIILPPIPAFYFGPRTIADLVDHSVGKILDLMDIEHTLFKRWEGIA